MIRLVRSIISSVSNGAVRLFSGSGLAGQSFTNREFIQQAGFASRPKAGTRGLVITMGNMVFCIASDDPEKRPEIAEGESVMYNDAGITLLFKEDGTVEMKGASAINFGNSHAALQALVDVRILQYLDGHRHGGVETGSGTSGTPTVPLVPLQNSIATQVVKAE